MNSFLNELGGFALFAVSMARSTLRQREGATRILAQFSDICWRALPTVAFAGLFVGAILVLQFHLILVKYDALSLLGGLNTSSVIRQVGPLIISFLLAGKVGAFTTAELGTMRVTEQIDAIECLGVDSMQYLVIPRFFGILISSVVLLLIGMLVSVVGAMFVASVACDVNTLEYLSAIPKFTDLWTLSGGAFQAFIYGSIVGGVACFKGYTAKGGARGVGRAVTTAAVYTNLYIVIANYLTARIIQWVTDFGQFILHGGNFS